MGFGNTSAKSFGSCPCKGAPVDMACDLEVYIQVCSAGRIKCLQELASGYVYW